MLEKRKRYSLILDYLSMILITSLLLYLFYIKYFNNSYLAFISYAILPLVTVFLQFSIISKISNKVKIESITVLLNIIPLAIWVLYNEVLSFYHIANFNNKIVKIVFALLCAVYILMIYKKNFSQYTVIAVSSIAYIILLYNCCYQAYVLTFQ